MIKQRTCYLKKIKRNPEDRPTAAELLYHPFFNPDASHSDEVLNEIKNLKDSIDKIEQLSNTILDKTVNIEKISYNTQQALVKGVLEIKRFIKTTNENTIPTVFIIRPVIDDSKMNKLRTEGNAVLDGINDDEKNASLDFFTKASTFYESMSTFTDSISNALNLQKSVFDIFNDEYEMVLLCQFCYTPQATKVWPVKLSKKKKEIENLCAKILPLVQAGIAVAKTVNGIGGIARILGYPVPTIPVEYVESGMKYLKHPTSVSDYEKLEKRLIEADSELNKNTDPKNLEGYSQREFKRYLDEVDEKHDWGELKCITLSEGYTMWCCQNCCNILETNPEASYEELRAKTTKDNYPDSSLFSATAM